MSSKRFENMTEFVLNYRAAEKVGLSYEELAYLLGLKPDTVARQRIKVKHSLGLDLPPLKQQRNTLKGQFAIEPSADDMEAYDDARENLRHVMNKSKAHDPETDKKKFVITSAQNATPVHERFLKCLQNYCEHNDAELMVIPYRYRNPTSIWTATDRNQEWWHNSILPYLVDKQIALNDNISVMGHIKIVPTAVHPLSGFDSYTGEASGIFGHPSIELKTIPTPAKDLPKILTTTGSVTVPNFTDTKLGHKGEFNFSLAATVVEIEGDAFYQRHIHGNDETGEFYDLTKLYTVNGVESGHRIEALVAGDIHAEFHDPDVERATYTDPHSIVNDLKPKVWVAHDLEDFYSRNHHHRGNDILTFAKHHFGRNNVEDGLQTSANFIDKHSRDGMQNIIVKSNHDEALDRWLREADPKSDPENAIFYHYMKYHQYKNIEMTDTGFDTIDPFEFWCNNPESCKGLQNIDRTTFLNRDTPFQIKDIELSYHGDIGPNGSRGSIKSLSKIGPKLIIGHSHCLTDNHSVLVLNKGWQNIKDVKEEDYVLSYNKEDYNEYVRVDKKYHFNHTGKLLTIGNSKWKQEVTDYHNLYLKDHTYSSVTNAIVTRCSGEVPLTAKGFVDGVREKDYHLELQDDDIRRIVALCADGAIQESKWIRFQLKKPRKIERLKKLFGEDLGEPNNTSNGYYKASLKTGSATYNLLKTYVDFSDKRIPDIFKQLPSRQKELFLEELQYWDGTFSPEQNGKQFSTAKEIEADIVSTIATELGYRNTCKLRHKKTDYAGIYHISWCKDRDYIFSSNKDRNDRERMNSWNVKTEEVRGKDVYCLVNRNSNFWIRHNPSGTTSLTGNSPGIFQGVYQVGLSARRNLEYARGPSSWMHCHCLIYPDGHRTLIHIINGKWRRIDE
jgi:hypothetical protein